MNKLQYTLYSIAAALIAGAESLKASADNVPDDSDDAIDVKTGEIIAIQPTTGTPFTNATPPAFDGAGLPWDERIHALTKTIKADGTWTKRRGATPPVVTAVEAELRARLAGSGTGTPTTTPPATTPTVPVVNLPTATAPIAPVPLTAYQTLCAWCAANTGEGKAAPTNWVDDTLKAQGTSLAALATDEAMSTAWLGAFKQALGQA